MCVCARVCTCECMYVCGMYMYMYRGQRWLAGLCYHTPPISWRQSLNFKLVWPSASPSISPDSTSMLHSPGIINMYATMLDFWLMCWGFEVNLHGYSASALSCRAVFPSPLVFTLQLVIQPVTFHPESLRFFSTLDVLTVWGMEAIYLSLIHAKPTLFYWCIFSFFLSSLFLSPP